MKFWKALEHMQIGHKVRREIGIERAVYSYCPECDVYLEISLQDRKAYATLADFIKSLSHIDINGDWEIYGSEGD